MTNLKAEKQHSPEQRAERARLFDTAFQASTRMPNFLSHELREAYFDGLTSDEFIAWLKEVNGALTGTDDSPSGFNERLGLVEERGLDGTESVQILPAYEDKAELLAYVLEAAQSADDLETKAMIVGFGINIVHPFEDGNGRTARTIHTLLSHNYEPSSKVLRDAIVERESKELVLAPSMLARTINGFLRDDMHSTINVNGSTYDRVLPRVKDETFSVADEYVTPRRETTFEAVNDMINIFSDDTVGPIVAYLLELKATYRSVRSSVKDNGNRQKVFYVDNFLTNASDEEVAMAYDLYREVTAARARLFVDVLSGRRYEDMLVAGRSKMNEIYTFQEMGRRAANGAMLRGIEHPVRN